MAADGTFVDGEPQLAADGTFVGGTPEMAPDGTFVGTHHKKQRTYTYDIPSYTPTQNSNSGSMQGNNSIQE